MVPTDYSRDPVAIDQTLYEAMMGRGYPSAEEQVNGKPTQVVRVPRPVFDRESWRIKKGRSGR